METLDHIENAAKHAIKFIEHIYFEGNKTFSSVLFKGLTEKSSVHLNDKFNPAHHLIEDLKDPKFDFVRNYKRYIEIEKLIERYSGEWKI